MRPSIAKDTGKKISLISRLIVVLIFAVCIVRLLIPTIENYAQTKIFKYTSDPVTDGSTFDLADGVQQNIIAKGNRLSNFSIYIGDNPYSEADDCNISVSILSDSKTIFNKNVNSSDLDPNSWNEVSIDLDGLNRGEIYQVSLNADKPGIFTFAGSGEGDSKYLSNSDNNYAVGVLYSYEYYTLGHGLLMLFNIVYGIFIIAITALTVFKVKDWRNIYSRQNIYKSVSSAMVLALSVLFMYNPMIQDNTKVEQFLRVQGAGIMGDYDVTRVIRNFSLWIIGFVIVFLFMLAFCSKIREEFSSDLPGEAWHYFDDFIIVALINYALRAITFFSDNTTARIAFYYSSNFISLVLVTLYSYVLLKLYLKVSFERFLQYFLCVYSMCIPAAALIHSEWESGILLFGLQFVASILLILLLKFIKVPDRLQKNNTALFIISFFAVLQPAALSFYIELINVLNQHKVFVKRVGKYYGVSIVLLFLIIAFVGFLLRKKEKTLPLLKKVFYPILVVGLSALSAQIPLTTTYSADLFETANSSILISDYLNFGKVPVVEHYGGHMMSGVWEGIIYGLLNNDKAGAIFSPYSGFIVVIISLIFYYLVSFIWSQDAALMTTLLFPFYGITNYYIQGALIALAAAAYVKKNTNVRAVLLWLACAWCTLYRLDLGFAFDFALVVALGLYVIATKNKHALKQLFITLVSVLLLFGLAWGAICIGHHVNPISRLLEFVKVSASNQDWAYNNIGNNGLAAYSWAYIFVPLAVAVVIVYLILDREFRGKIGNEKWVLLLCIGFSYFFNFSRGLVRHSLAEMALTIVMWSAYLFISIFVAIKFEKKLFLPTLIGFTLLNSLFAGNGNFVSYPITDSAYSKIDPMVESWHIARFAYDEAPDGEMPETYWKKIQDNQMVVNRAEWNDGLKSQIIPVKTITDALLKDDETFVDFTNVTFMYSALGRLNPVYVSQSPLQLSGEYTQQQFVEEIARNPEKNPIVLMPRYNNMGHAGVALDGLANNYRNYIVAEYLYKNYRPLCGYGEFAIWCLKDRYEKLKESFHNFSAQTDYTESIVTSTIPFAYGGCEFAVGSEGIRMAANSTDPIWSNFGEYIGVNNFGRNTIKISITYESDIKGDMQLFYTTDEGEEYYSEDKSVIKEINNGRGTVSFDVSVNEYTKLRLDTPPNSNVCIKKVEVGYSSELLNYGYDRQLKDNRIDDSTSLHIYGLGYLPKIWGESDERNAINNDVQSEIHNMGEYYQIDSPEKIDKTEGNYLKISAEYNGHDMSPNEDTTPNHLRKAYEIDGKYMTSTGDENYSKDDDESTGATVRLGTIVNGKFIEKYKYSMTIAEGSHDYLIRVSNDYSWYVADIDAIQLESSEKLYGVNMSILKGDSAE
jgi:hypothetical protein